MGRSAPPREATSACCPSEAYPSADDSWGRSLYALEATTAEVRRSAVALDGELQRWRGRSLGDTPYLILYARYEKVRPGGQVRLYAVLAAIGIDPQGKRSVIGVSVALSEPRHTAGSSRPWTPG